MHFGTLDLVPWLHCTKWRSLGSQPEVYAGRIVQGTGRLPPIPEAEASAESFCQFELQ
jgi:hypothetical protein